MRRRAIGRWVAAVLCVAVAAVVPARAGERRTGLFGRPKADVQNAKYGPHERNVLDLWKAESETPTPLVVYIHGGGFRGGDKRSVRPALLKLCLEAGISVAAINYRFSQHASRPSLSSAFSTTVSAKPIHTATSAPAKARHARPMLPPFNSSRPPLSTSPDNLPAPPPLPATKHCRIL